MRSTESRARLEQVLGATDAGARGSTAPASCRSARESADSGCARSCPRGARSAPARAARVVRRRASAAAARATAPSAVGGRVDDELRLAAVALERHHREARRIGGRVPRRGRAAPCAGRGRGRRRRRPRSGSGRCRRRARRVDVDRGIAARELGERRANASSRAGRRAGRPRRGRRRPEQIDAMRDRRAAATRTERGDERARKRSSRVVDAGHDDRVGARQTPRRSDRRPHVEGAGVDGCVTPQTRTR